MDGERPDRRPNQEQFRIREQTRKEFARRLTRARAAAGVPIVAGTDPSAPGLFPGHSLHDELEEMVASGLSTLDALRTATTTAGTFLESRLPTRPRLGKVREGYAADLLLLRASPEKRISNTREIAGVVRHGRYFPVADLIELRRAAR